MRLWQSLIAMFGLCLQPVKGCNKQDICLCVQNGKVNGMLMKYEVQKCKDGVPDINPSTESQHLVMGSISGDPLVFGCDSLKLEAYCYKAHECLDDERRKSCEKVKPAGCDVDCNAAVFLAATPGLIFTLLAALT
mmetsp:Transcript_146845/g.256221  ORF Transcript_146845/g.256221 Transcript_146845/m.256221 type:complete len:135 (+) Transcript_146845:206-610(+)